MGIVQSIAEKMTGGSSVETAERAAAKATADLRAEDARILACEGNLEQADATIRALDPDADDRSFAKAVQARDALRGRLEALRARRARIAGEVSATAQAARDAVLDAKREQRDALDREIAEISTHLRAESLQLGRVIADRIARLRELSSQATRLDGEVQREEKARGERDSLHVVEGRRCKWVSFWGYGIDPSTPGGALTIAGRVVGGE